ncbi:MAG: hypothetical protein AAGA96_17990 [Verrucomicrobiota bacterium]
MDEPSWLERTRGYIDLGMFKEALAEIEQLPSDQRSSPEVQEMRITIELDRGDLEHALDLSENLVDLFPDNHAGFIQGAYCLHAMGETQRAIDHLQSGPLSLQDEAVYYYNLACYEVALNRADAAFSWLQQAIEMDPSNRSRALADPDLALLHPRLQKKKN